MKFSEAMALGHTLIREEATCFLVPDGADYYYTPGPCGCAIGSALAAMGETDVDDGIEACEERWPWTAAPCPKELRRELEKLARVSGAHFSKDDSIALVVSATHFWGAPRLKIAEVLSRYEPQELPAASLETQEATA